MSKRGVVRSSGRTVTVKGERTKDGQKQYQVVHSDGWTTWIRAEAIDLVLSARDNDE
jgi:hypothetical protein